MNDELHIRISNQNLAANQIYRAGNIRSATTSAQTNPPNNTATASAGQEVINDKPARYSSEDVENEQTRQQFTDQRPAEREDGLLK